MSQARIIARQTTFEDGCEVETTVTKTLSHAKNQELLNTLMGILLKREMVPYVTPRIWRGEKLEPVPCRVIVEIQGTDGVCRGTWQPDGMLVWNQHPYDASTLQATGVELSNLLPSEWEIPDGLQDQLVERHFSNR